MCGIFGQISEQQANAESIQSLAHRGPDDQGIYTAGVPGTGKMLTLMHRRLSIIDLSPEGHQPMSNEDGSIWITFNGEIYNYVELAEQLRARGHQFRSHCDTEVIIHGYEEWGEQVVEHLRGMFAFGIWDARRSRLFLARDRGGKKPLFYFLSDGAIAFGSEIKAILASGLVEPELDVHSLHDYLTYLYFPAPRTAYKNISKLPAAHCMSVEIDSAGKLRARTSRFWDVLAAPDDPDARSEKTAIPKLRHLMREAVKVRLMSDVPLGITLSGGLDSSTITGLVSEVSDSEINTFTLGFAQKNYDEVPLAKLVARHFNTRHRVLQADASCSREMTTVVRHFDEPFGNPTAVLELILARAMREHVTVALSGDGADEAMGGYPRYIGAVFADRVRQMPRFLTKNVLASSAAFVRDSNQGNHTARRIREFGQAAWMSEQDAYLSWVGYFSEQEKRELYTQEFSECVGERDSGEFLRDLYRGAEKLDIINRSGYVDLMSFMTFNCLEYSDRMSMASSLELRCPFTDHKLLEFAYQMPGRMKVSAYRMRLKSGMRKAVGDLLPPEILRHGKIGFNPPMAAWIDGELRGMIRNMLSPEVIRNRGLFDPKAIQTLLQEHWEHRRDNGLKIWAILMIEIWMRMYLDRQSEADLSSELMQAASL